jgi:hypothetical protein
MPRLVYLAGVGLVLVALAFAVTDRALSLLPGVTEAHVKRIRPGMTLAQVEEILGGLAGLTARPADGLQVRRLWSGRTGYAWVHFDAQGAVISADFSLHSDH